MSIAFVFPGQGSQAVGMADALAGAYASARAVFEDVDEALGQDLTALMREGPEETLRMTENAQPALMAVSLAGMAVLRDEFGVGVESASFLAGHSLGEYSALCAAGSLSIADAARLLRLRGQAMQTAVPVGEGAMAALLGADKDQAKALCAVGAEHGVCEIANDNAPGQIVISGAKPAVEAAIAAARDHGVKRGMLLPVSAPFHCSLMAPAAEAMDKALGEAALSDPARPVVANVTAEAVGEAEQIRRLLVEQVTGRVRWRESVEWMAALGVSRFVEIGAGNVLTGTIKRIAPDAEALALNAPEDFEAFAKTL